jgi:Nucleotidyl transferase AbiEii toxin, Type IV TA system
VSASDYIALIGASPRDRLDAFLATANRLGAPVGNIEKDFWVCWTLNALYHQLPQGQPRLLFKGGTSLSKAYGLIERFSEDIDVTVFRDDLDQPASFEELEALSNKKRRAKLDAIRDACRAYVTGTLCASLTGIVADATSGAGRVEIDDADSDGQTLLVHYPAVEPRDGAYVRPVVRIESGAKSALDPNTPVTIRPYVADEIESLDLAVPDVTTIEAQRTFWDKVVIAHGLRRWYDRRGELRQEGQRISRHYYDLHHLAASEPGRLALANAALGEDCVRHARVFFDRPDYDLSSAQRGTYALVPHDAMTQALRNDYENTRAMIFGEPPTFDAILSSIARIEAQLNRRR